MPRRAGAEPSGPHSPIALEERRRLQSLMPSLSQTLAKEDPALLEKLGQRATDEALTRRSLAAATDDVPSEMGR